MALKHRRVCSLYIQTLRKPAQNITFGSTYYNYCERCVTFCAVCFCLGRSSSSQACGQHPCSSHMAGVPARPTRIWFSSACHPKWLHAPRTRVRRALAGPQDEVGGGLPPEVVACPCALSLTLLTILAALGGEPLANVNGYCKHASCSKCSCKPISVIWVKECILRAHSSCPAHRGECATYFLQVGLGER
jgi:hypothetical protein